MAKDDHKNRSEYFEDRAGTKEARYHVVPDDEKGWAIKVEGEDGHQHQTDSKDEAVKKAKELAKDAGTMVYVHSEHGKIEEQFNYMDDDKDQKKQQRQEEQK